MVIRPTFNLAAWKQFIDNLKYIVLAKGLRTQRRFKFLEQLGSQQRLIVGVAMNFVLVNALKRKKHCHKNSESIFQSHIIFREVSVVE